MSANRIAVIGPIALCLAAAPLVRAQYTANYQTNIISGVTSNWTGNYLVGSNTFADVLLLQNGGILFDDNGELGHEGSSSSNSVMVNRSFWLGRANNSSLSVGRGGAANSLVISNAGRVSHSHGYIGNNATATGNSVVVTGPDSRWDGEDLCVGVSGTGNMFLATSAGAIYTTYGYIGSNTTATGNAVIVRDTDSHWNNDSDLYVGFAGSANSLTVSNGGQAFSDPSYVGYESSGAGNRVLVSGSNSIWNSGTTLKVGVSSAGNALVISNGGQVFSYLHDVGSGAGYGYVGWDRGASNNSVLVTSTGSVWNGGNLYIGYGGSSNVLAITGGSVVACNLFISYTDASYGIASNNLVRVDGGNLVVTNTCVNASLVVGRSGGKGQLIIDGGTVTTDLLIATNGLNSVVTFNKGLLNGRVATAVTNGAIFSVGNGVEAAEFHLLGGIHSFANGMEIRSNAVLSGTGTITGNVLVDPTGKVLAIGGGVHADIYSGFTHSGGGASYSNLVGSLYSWGVSFATDNCYDWHPFDLFEFGADITGLLGVSENGTYTFSLNSDDGSLLFIDGGLVVNNGGEHLPGTASGSATLSAGVHPFEVQFFECCAGPSGVDLILPVGVTYVQGNSNAVLTFTGSVTNNGTMQAVGGATLEFYGPVVNNGLIDVIYGNTNFHSTFINNGIVLDAAGDWDGDGMSNLEESQAGTDPTNSASWLCIKSLVRTGNDVRITWATAGGRTNAVQVTAGTANGGFTNNFINLSGPIRIQGTGDATTNYIDVAGATNAPSRYYRIRLVP